MNKVAVVLFLAACGVAQPETATAEPQTALQTLESVEQSVEQPAEAAGGGCDALCAAASCRPWHTIGQCIECIVQCCTMSPTQC